MGRRESFTLRGARRSLYRWTRGRVSRAPIVLMLGIVGCFVRNPMAGGDDEGATTSTGGSSTASLSVGSQADSGATEGESGADLCEGAPCLERPDGWNGPVLVDEAAIGTSSPCVSGEAFSARTGLTAGPAECGCECVPPQIDCSQQAAWLSAAPTEDCVSTLQEDLAIGCNDTDDYDYDLYMSFTAVDPDLSRESCTPLPSEFLPDFEWEQEVRGCEIPGDSADCGTNGRCFNFQASPGDVCVWQEGDLPCPAGSFESRTVAFRDAVDERRCGACECSSVVGGCVGTLTLNGNSLCSTVEQGPIGEEDCFHLEAAPVSSVELVVEGIFSCQPGGGGSIGSMTPVEPVTYCCLA